MTKSKGVLRKMSAKLAEPIEYSLSLSELEFPLTEQLECNVSLSFTGKIFCIQCGRKISKSFQQGHCYPCYRRLLECNLCVIHPERCLVETGACPVDDWAHAQCHKTHVIYLANTSGLKVGITRKPQVPTRWIDQGAIQAVPIFEVGNRYRAGVVEVALKEFVADKTNWRAMLKNEVTPLDLSEEREKLLQIAEESLLKATEACAGEVDYLNEAPVTLSYPVISYPEKVKSLSFDKTPQVSGKLLGIKGQYLLLETGVINLRKFGGYELEVELK